MRKFFVTCLLGLFLMTGVGYGSVMSQGLMEWLIRVVGEVAAQYIAGQLEGGGGGATSSTGKWHTLNIRCPMPGGWAGTMHACVPGANLTCHATECVQIYPREKFEKNP